MTPLGAIIRREIAATGPMPVSRYMDLCLSHPEHGYYTTGTPLGVEGDFTTAPEISQMFGEMIGVWVASAMAAIGAEARLVELGPGRGTMMADILGVLDRQGLRPEVWLVETSPRLRGEQARRVPGGNWVDALADVPEGPMVLVANEFIDALPVRQYLRADNGWRERQIGLDGDRLIWGLSGVVPGMVPATPGDWLERSAGAEATIAAIRARLDAAPGAALIIDYGYRVEDRPTGPTLQAVRGHGYADPLDRPGEADLTWLVDFDALAHDLGPAARVTTQGALLARLGIGARAAGLAHAHPEQADSIADALERLTDPEQMGSLFKAACVASPGLAPLPGFEETT